MIYNYAKFFINGSILGIIAWGLQLLIYHGLGRNSAAFYALASALTYAPLLVINFLIQRSVIFKRSGIFKRFVTANLGIMLIVSVLSPLCSLAMSYSFGDPWGDRTGFAIAALLSSIPSFFINNHWVFRSN
jgi:hypothetical protein